jgi:hypothetical protein
MGLVQLVSNQPLITHQLPNQTQLVLGGEPVETWHVQPCDVYSVCHQASTSLPLVADLLYATADMIAVYDLKLDRSTQSFLHVQQPAPLALNAMTENRNISDVWRVQNLGIKDYTCFSAYHKSYSRIDCFLYLGTLSMYVTPIQILPATLVSHNPLLTQLDVNFKVNKTKRWRFNTTLLQNKLFVAEFQVKG